MSLVFSPTPQNQTLETLLMEATCTLSRDTCTRTCSRDAYNFRKSTEAPSKNPHFNHCSPLLEPTRLSGCLLQQPLLEFTEPQRRSYKQQHWGLAGEATGWPLMLETVEGREQQ